MTTDEDHQSAEQHGELVESGEILPCAVSRGDATVTEEDAVRAFALAVSGQPTPGISDLDTDSATLKAARWVGVQPTGYLDVPEGWYLSDAAESMSRGHWGEAVYVIEKFVSVRESKT